MKRIVLVLALALVVSMVDTTAFSVISAMETFGYNTSDDYITPHVTATTEASTANNDVIGHINTLGAGNMTNAIGLNLNLASQLAFSATDDDDDDDDEYYDEEPYEAYYYDEAEYDDYETESETEEDAYDKTTLGAVTVINHLLPYETLSGTRTDVEENTDIHIYRAPNQPALSEGTYQWRFIDWDLGDDTLTLDTFDESIDDGIRYRSTFTMPNDHVYAIALWHLYPPCLNEPTLTPISFEVHSITPPAMFTTEYKLVNIETETIITDWSNQYYFYDLEPETMYHVYVRFVPVNDEAYDETENGETTAETIESIHHNIYALDPLAVTTPPTTLTVIYYYDYDLDIILYTETVDFGSLARNFAPYRSENPENYTFINWTTDLGGQEVWLFTTPVTTHLSLFAQWTDDLTNNTVTFYYNFGDNEVFYIGSVSPGALLSSPSDPTRPHYTFAGWETDPENGESWDFESAIITEDVALYAQWDPIYFDIIFEVNNIAGGIIDGTDTITLYDVRSGTTIEAAPLIETYPGWRFIGWTLDDNLISEAALLTMEVLYDLVLVAYFEHAPQDMRYTVIVNVVDDQGRQIRHADVMVNHANIHYTGWRWMASFDTPVTGVTSASALGFTSEQQRLLVFDYADNVAYITIALARTTDAALEIYASLDDALRNRPTLLPTTAQRPTISEGPLQNRPSLAAALLRGDPPIVPYAPRFRRGIVDPASHTFAHPYRNPTRAEMIDVFFRLSTVREFEATNVRFTDVGPDDWFFEAAAYLEYHGAIQGFPDGTFRPYEPITNAEFATLTAKFFNLANEVTTGAAILIDAESHWGAEYVNLTFTNDLFAYLEMNDAFNPDLPIMAEQTIALINFYQGHIPCISAIHHFLGSTDRDLFPYLARSHWSFYEIVDAALSRHYHFNSDFEEVWVLVLN